MAWALHRPRPARSLTRRGPCEGPVVVLRGERGRTRRSAAPRARRHPPGCRGRSERRRARFCGPATAHRSRWISARSPALGRATPLVVKPVSAQARLCACSARRRGDCGPEIARGAAESAVRHGALARGGRQPGGRAAIGGPPDVHSRAMDSSTGVWTRYQECRPGEHLKPHTCPQETACAIDSPTSRASP
jgi:hypothetical protein